MKKYTDGCSSGLADGCFAELRYSLATIFGVQLIVQNFGEVCGTWLEGSGEIFLSKKSPEFAQFNKPELDSMFEDFCEIILKFGYCTIFVIAFPLTPLLALGSNIFEIRNFFLFVNFI